MTYKVLQGDCIEKLRELIAEGVQVDSIVTDPPYELGFMGKSWDSTGIAYSTELWQLCLQVLKPGGQQFSHGSYTDQKGKWGLKMRAEGGFEDKGSASRFFYCAKASKKDRQGSKHPTVKPVSLMRYLCRLITPPGGTVLDPFAGTGTTGQAALEEGFQAILIEKESEHIADINRRMNKVALPLCAFDEVANG